jgi:hypothetical protein
MRVLQIAERVDVRPQRVIAALGIIDVIDNFLNVGQRVFDEMVFVANFRIVVEVFAHGLSPSSTRNGCQRVSRVR